MKRKLTLEELKELKKLHETTDMTWSQKGERFGVSGEYARGVYRSYTKTTASSYRFNKVDESPYPKYDSPLEQEGDCLVIPDLDHGFFADGGFTEPGRGLCGVLPGRGPTLF